MLFFKLKENKNADFPQYIGKDREIRDTGTPFSMPPDQPVLLRVTPGKPLCDPQSKNSVRPFQTILLPVIIKTAAHRQTAAVIAVADIQCKTSAESVGTAGKLVSPYCLICRLCHISRRRSVVSSRSSQGDFAENVAGVSFFQGVNGNHVQTKRFAGHLKEKQIQQFPVILNLFS